MKSFTIECGVDAPSDPGAIALSVGGPGKNVNLRLDYISRSMVRNVPDLLVDILEVAAYVYCADQRLPRGSAKLTEYGADWRRSLDFNVPVRRPEIWESSEVQRALTETLGFLSDDSYEFEFRRAEAPAIEREAYFKDLIDSSLESDEVALFSGGVDSFAGVVDAVANRGRTVTLVGHHAAPKIRNVQEALVEGLREKGHKRRFSYIPVLVSNEGIQAVEHTQRPRSFLFACLGLVVAQLTGKDSFTFYENGVVSINPALAGDILGARATRTTHPKVLRGLETLFSALLDRPIEIRTPFAWLTKTEVTQLFHDAGLSDMLARTVSCTRTRLWTSQQKHCGLCSQCIDRRFAVLAAGLAEFEPAQNYKRDLLLGDRSADDDLRMALSYVAFFRKIGLTSKREFLTEHSEVVSALEHFPGLTPEKAGSRLYDLFQRHAASVGGVITSALREHSDELYQGLIPSGSLLATCFSSAHVQVAPPSDYDKDVTEFIDRLAAPVLDFAFDDAGKKVLFSGGLSLEGAYFQVVEVLVGNFRKAKNTRSDPSYVPPHELADRLGLEEQSMRQRVGRLRKELEPLAVMLGIPLDQNSFIETKERAGYRLNPACREVSLGDIT